MTTTLRPPSREVIPRLVAAIRAYDRAHQHTRCTTCGATWDTNDGSECRWCAETLQHLLDDERRALLHPVWAQDRGPRYDQLDPVDQTIWDRTRGTTAGEGAITFWAARLRRAIDSGLVTVREADQALRRVARWQQSQEPAA